MTLALQWARYLDCNPGGKRLYRYSQFCKRVGDYARTHDLAARIAHVPGRLMLVDRAGLTAAVFDPATGRRSPAHLFVPTFPWSGWIYAECLPDHAHALVDIRPCARPAGRRGRTRHPRARRHRHRPPPEGEPVKVNDAYLEMAEHYGCAVVPARVRRPRDKAAAERAVDLYETWVLAPLAGERFS